jgi:hypothetical protein
MSWRGSIGEVGVARCPMFEEVADLGGEVAACRGCQTDQVISVNSVQCVKSFRDDDVETVDIPGPEEQLRVVDRGQSLGWPIA